MKIVDPQAVFDTELSRLKLMDAVAASRLKAAHDALMAQAASRGNGQKSLMFDPQAEEKDRRVQREKVLAALRRARSTGCTNGELNEICFRYGARIWEMRHDPENPLKISTVREGKSQFRYFLAAEHWQGGDPR